MPYTPFDVELDELTETHIDDLRQVAEGWYVEYKSEAPGPREIAKSLSSFANRYGGWLVIGVQEDPVDNTAHGFPGIPDSNVTSAVQRIRDAAKDLLQPTVPFFHTALSGPLPEIDLPQGRSLVVVRVPEGDLPPYVHNDGRVYVRTGDSSSPAAATDRATLDLLHRKAANNMGMLRELVDRSPEVSQSEETTTYVHLAICSDPFGSLGHWYPGSFQAFSTLMSGPPLPFDNAYTSQEGFVARQVLNNDPELRVFTWEFSRTCNSFVTLPVSALSLQFVGDKLYSTPEWKQFDFGEQFCALIEKRRLESDKVLNLNLLVSMIVGIINRHRELASSAGVHGPFYIKAIVENTWRAVPFIDIGEYITHVEQFGFPVVQDSEVTAPMGGWPEGFIVDRPTGKPTDQETAPDFGSAVSLWLSILQALGIPMEVLGTGAKDALRVAAKEAARHAERSGASKEPQNSAELRMD
ncbi:MAG: ATP-binding protein [Chloroflexi bacterium]|nr:ATP-binding protein [Chloroflexota bacterium]